MGKAISEAKIIELNTLYLGLKSYAAVSRAMGGSPSPTTVKKYIIPNFQPPKLIQQSTYNAARRRSIEQNQVFNCPTDIEELWVSPRSAAEISELDEFRKEIVV